MYAHRVQLRWGDFDALQHLNNVSYVEFMQDARVGIMQHFGLTRDELTNVGHVVKTCEIEYIKSAEMTLTELVVQVRLTKLGGASYTLNYEFVDDEGNVYAKGSTVMVTVQMSDYSVVRVPDQLRSIMERELN